jgi:MFS family permease
VNYDKPPTSRPGWLIKSVVLLSSVPMALAFASVTPILPKMSAALAHNATDAYLVKMMLGVIGIAMVIGAPLGGLLADKFERRRLLVTVSLVFALAGTAPFMLDNLPLILGTRLVMGLAGIFAYIVGVALVADLFEETDRARWMGIFTAVSIAGAVMATLVAGLLGDLGWRWAFLTYLIGLPVAGLAWVGLRNMPSERASRTMSVRGGAVRRTSFPFSLAGLALLVGIITYAPSIYLPFHLAALGAVHPSTIGLSMALTLVASTLASSLFGRARRTLSARAAFCCSFAAIAAGLAAVAIAPNYSVALLGLAVIGLGSGWLSPNLMASAADAVDESLRGRTLGVIRGAVSLAPALGVTALEPVASRVGAKGVLVLTATLAVVMLLGMAGSMARRRAPRAGYASPCQTGPRGK